MRVFIALPLPEEIKHEVVAVQNEVKRLNPKIRVKWTEYENLHVTLEFLGDITPEQVEQVTAMLADTIGKIPVFNFWLDRVDGFPNLNRPQVLHVRIADQKRESDQLRTALQKGLRQLGLKISDHAWDPHITLGRIKQIHLRSDVRRSYGGQDWNSPVGLGQIKVEPVSWKVGEVQLMASKLTSNGSVYTILARVRL